MGMTAVEVVGLLNRTSARPSVQHRAGWCGRSDHRELDTPRRGCLTRTAWFEAPHRTTVFIYDPAAPIHWLAWPLWTFVAVVMFAFVSQSVRFDQPGADDGADLPGRSWRWPTWACSAASCSSSAGSARPHEGLVAVAALIATAEGGRHAAPTPLAGSPAATSSGLGSARTRRSRVRSAACSSASSAALARHGRGPSIVRHPDAERSRGVGLRRAGRRRRPSWAI